MCVCVSEVEVMTVLHGQGETNTEKKVKVRQTQSGLRNLFEVSVS